MAVSGHAQHSNRAEAEQDFCGFLTPYLSLFTTIENVAEIWRRRLHEYMMRAIARRASAAKHKPKCEHAGALAFCAQLLYPLGNPIALRFIVRSRQANH